MNIIISACGFIFPILLFLIKYVLPACYEAALTEKKEEREKIKHVLIHFPNELLIIAIGYTVPKLLNLIGNQDFSIDSILWNLGFSFLVLIGLPFMVALTRIADNCYYADDKGKALFLTIIYYVISIGIIIVSIFLGVF